MKKLKKAWRNFIEKHIAQNDPYNKAIDIAMPHSSTEYHLAYDESDLRFIIEHDLLCEQAISSLREEGWDVQLETDDSGKLFYAVYDKVSFNRRDCFLSSFHD